MKKYLKFIVIRVRSPHSAYQPIRKVQLALSIANTYHRVCSD